LLLGLVVFAVVGGLAAWALVRLAWILGVVLKRRRRRRDVGDGTRRQLRDSGVPDQ